MRWPAASNRNVAGSAPLQRGSRPSIASCRRRPSDKTSHPVASRCRRAPPRVAAPRRPARVVGSSPRSSPGAGPLRGAGDRTQKIRQLFAADHTTVAHTLTSTSGAAAGFRFSQIVASDALRTRSRSRSRYASGAARGIVTTGPTRNERVHRSAIRHADAIGQRAAQTPRRRDRAGGLSARHFLGNSAGFPWVEACANVAAVRSRSELVAEIPFRPCLHPNPRNSSTWLAKSSTAGIEFAARSPSEGWALSKRREARRDRTFRLRSRCYIARWRGHRGRRPVPERSARDGHDRPSEHRRPRTPTLGGAAGNLPYPGARVPRGPTLGEAIAASGPMPVPRALRIARCSCVGAGGRALARCDPSRPDVGQRLPVKSEGDSENAKVLDFGISKFLDRDRSPKTRRGFTMGTPSSWRRADRSPRRSRRARRHLRAGRDHVPTCSRQDAVRRR